MWVLDLWIDFHLNLNNQEMLSFLNDDLKQYEYPDNEITEINYPVNEYPE